jgi:hypothetical protein
VLLAIVVIWRWFAVQIPAQKAQQTAIFKSILYEYIFETLHQNTLIQTESIAEQLSNYRKYLPVNDKSIANDYIIQDTLNDFQAEPIPQENGMVAYSLLHIKQELQVKREKFKKI